MRKPLFTLTLFLAVAPPLAAQPCDPAWSRDYTMARFGYPQWPSALTSYTVEGQPRVVVGGEFRFYPPLEGGGYNLAWWNGEVWDHVGDADPSGPVSAMLVWDDPNDDQGEYLYIGGEFREVGEDHVRNIARWNGQDWLFMDTGFNDPQHPGFTEVRAFAIYDDGQGPFLYAGGRFTKSGDLTQDLGFIARWDGQEWQPLGGGLAMSKQVSKPGVHAMTVFDDGTGPVLCVAGCFDSADGGPVTGLAGWDGSSWLPLGAPLLPRCDGCTPWVTAACSFDDGSGPALYIAGASFQAPGVPRPHSARLRNGQWEPAGDFYEHHKENADLIVHRLAVHDLGEGASLYAVGRFMTYDAPEDVKFGGCLARWDPGAKTWIDLDANPIVRDVLPFDDGQGMRLWVGGPFAGAGQATPGGETPNLIATLGPDGWRSIGNGAASGPYLRTFDDGSGMAVYIDHGGNAWGEFEPTSGGLIRLRADGWSSVGSWTDLDPEIAGGIIYGMDVVDMGDGPRLYVNAQLYHEDGFKAFDGYTRWDGAHWSSVSNDDWNEMGLSPPERIFSYDDGNGRRLYFLTGGQKQDIYRLEGDHWQLWADGDGFLPQNTSLCVAMEYDDGTGNALWVGGDLGEIEGVEARGLARYRPGVGWEAMGTFDEHVLDLEVWDDGTGPALYASGAFTFINGKKINRIARWDADDQTWRALGQGLGPGGNDYSSAEMMVYDDGTGPALWANGRFTTAGGKAIKYIAKWDGQDWSGLEGSTDFQPSDIAGADIGMGPTIYQHGEFRYADGYLSAGFAAYHFCPPGDCPADLDGNGTVDLFDFLTFVNYFNTLDPRADCDGSGAFDLFDFFCFVNAFNAGC
jgi:hypothetical protein